MIRLAKKKEEKLKIRGALASKPTYTPINSSLNATYKPQEFKRSSNIVVSQEDLMPAQRQALPPIQVRGALVPPKPKEMFGPPVPPNFTGPTAKPIGLPSMQQQLETATTAFTPQSVNKNLRPFQGPEKPTMGETFEQRIAAGREATEGQPVKSFINRLLEPITALGTLTEKPAQIAGQFYTPGAGLSAITGATGAAENLIARVAPNIGRGTGLGATVAREALKEGMVGAPLAAGQALAQNPGISGKEFAQQTALGAGLGAAVGPVAPLAGKGIQAIRGALSGKTSAVRAVEDAAETVLTASPEVTPTVKPDLEASNIKAPITSRQALSPSSQGSEKGIRANYRNQLENGNFSSELQQAIRDTDQTYDIARNVDTIAAANEKVKDLPKAEADFLANEALGPEHIATGYRLMQQLDALGEHQRSLNVANKLAKDLTKGGQTTQAASLLARLSPEGQLLNLTRTAARNGKEVSVADKVKFQELAAVVQENTGAGVRANQFDDILNRLEKGETVSPEELKVLGNMLERANKYTKPSKPVKQMKDVLPDELKDVRKRDKIVSFLDEAEQAALARIAARKTRLNSLPIDEWRDHAIVVASQIAKGTIKAATYAEDMVKLLGEEVRPVAAEIFEKAQKMVKGTARSVSEGKLDQASRALRNISGETQKEKALVEEMAGHVRKVIADSKEGKLDPNDVQKLRDYSDEIAEMTADKKPFSLPTPEQKYLQSVKALAKKIAQVESESIPADKANREVSNLLRQITKISKEGELAPFLEPIDNKALSDIAHDVMEKTRPTPKPTTLQEKIVEKYIKDNPVSEEDIQKLRALAKQVNELSGDEATNADMAMQKILNSYEKSSAWDKVQALRYIAMLLNSSTQAVNAISGPIMASSGTIADVFGTMIDIPMSKLLKKQRTTTLYGTNPLAFIAQWIKGSKVGGKAGWHGVNPAGIAGPNEIRGLTFKSPYNPFGIAERSLGAVAKGADYGTYKAVQTSEMRKIAYLDAKNKGIKGKANIDNHIEQFINEPPDEAILQADRIAKNTTFQRSDSLGGKVANFLNTAPGPVKPLTTAIFPFVRTPINIASTAVTLTPGGIIKGLYQLTSKSDASRREAIRTLSLGLTGTGILTPLGFYLSKAGIITGSNDSGDKDVDAIREQAGQGKYRFNTSALSRYLKAMLEGKGPEAAERAAKYQEGDKQFDYNKLQPLAFPLAIGAGLEDNKEGTAAKMLESAGVDAYGSLYGMSTLRGVQDVFQPSYGGTVGEKALGLPARVITSFLKSFSPSAIAQEARRQDPIQRKTSYNNGILEDTSSYFKSRTPGLSQSLPPNKTTLGQNKLNAPGITGQYLNPYKSDVAPYNEAAAFITKLIESTGDETLAPSAPDKKVSGKDKSGQKVTIAIPPDRYAKYQEELGNEISNKIIAIPSGLTDEQKAARVLKIYDTVKEKYRNILKRELGIRISR